MKKLAMAGVISSVTLLAACGGGGDDAGNASQSGENSSVSTGAGATSIDPNVLGSECLQTVPANKKSHVTASWIAPVEIDVVDIVGQGLQTFEGSAYPSIDVRNTDDDTPPKNQHHVVYLQPQAPVLPAAAITYATPGTSETDLRYRFTYADSTISALLASGKLKLNTNAGWSNTAAAVTPNLAGLAIGQAKTYTVFRQRGDANGVYQNGPDSNVTELTFTYQGRENVSAPDGTYAQACKVTVDAKVSRSYSPQPVAAMHGTVWFAPGIGPVHVAVTTASSNVPALDMFIPAAQ